MRSKHVWWIIAGMVVLGAALWGPIVSNVEQPKFVVLEKQDSIEIREYAPMIVAEADVSGEREKAIREGFRTIADYIFGNNASAQKLAMTAPVTQQGSEKVMSAPATQQAEGGSWRVRFFMPASYAMETLPKPKNPAVKLKEIAGRRFAVIRFSGSAGDDSLELHTAELNKFVSEKNLKVAAAPMFAFYNPPWTLPFLRRNEIMVEIAS